MTEFDKKSLPPFLASASIVSLLWLTGVLLAACFFMCQRFYEIKEQQRVLVEVKNSATDKDLDDLNALVRSIGCIDPPSIEWIDKKAAAALLSEELHLNIGEENGLPNPLSDVLTFKVQAECQNIEKLTELQKSLYISNAVEGVFHHQSDLDAVANALTKIIFFCFLIIVGLLFSIRLIVLQAQQLTPKSYFKSDQKLKSFWRGIIAAFFVGLSIFYAQLTFHCFDPLDIQTIIDYGMVLLFVVLLSFLLDWRQPPTQDAPKTVE